MSLSERMKSHHERMTYAPTPKPRASAPKGWEPGVKFDSDNMPVEITSPPVENVGEDYAKVLEEMHVTLPEGYSLQLIEARFDPAAWHRDNQGEDAVTRPAWRYKFKVVEDALEGSYNHVVDLLNDLRTTSTKRKTKFTGDASYQSAISDTQYGKCVSTGGTDDLLERMDRFYELSIDRVKQLGKKNIGQLVIPLLGDLIEGCSIYPNQQWSIDRDMREQIKGASLLILDYLDRIAPMFESVVVPCAPGNHGENRIGGKRVQRHDNFDQLVAEQVALAAERDPKLQHVNFVIAGYEPYVTLDVQGHTYAYTHGSVYGKGKGNTPELKAYNWYANQAAGHRPVGDATTLVGAHFHHEVVKNFGNMLFMQTPAMDGGSPEFSDYSGQDAQSGMLTWVTTADEKMRDWMVLR